MTAPNLDGKVVVVTGGNSGIGKQAALELAGMGATVVIAARNPQKAAAAVNEIRGATNAGDRVDTIPIDLTSFASVRAFVDAFTARHDQLDVLLPGSVAAGQHWKGHHLPLSGWRWDQPDGTRPLTRPTTPAIAAT